MFCQNLNGKKVDKENYKLEDHKYLHDMRTPNGTEQAANQFITAPTRAAGKLSAHKKSKCRRKKKISWSPKLAKAVTDLKKKPSTYGKKNWFTSFKKQHLQYKTVCC